MHTNQLKDSRYKNIWKELDRMNDLALAEISAKVQTDVAAARKKSAAGKAIGNLIGSIGSAYISSVFGG